MENVSVKILNQHFRINSESFMLPCPFTLMLLQDCLLPSYYAKIPKVPSIYLMLVLPH
jgi:hypothetical protein